MLFTVIIRLQVVIEDIAKFWTKKSSVKLLSEYLK